MSGGLTEEERLLQATAREFATREVAPTADRARRGRAIRPVAVHADGRARPHGGAVARIDRWGRLLVPRLDAGHGGARRGRHGHRGLAVGPHPVAAPGRHLGNARAAGALAAGDAGRRGPGRVRPDRAPRRQRRRGDPDPRGGRGTGRRADGVPPDRDEDLDLERARGGPVPRLRDARSRAPAPRASPHSSSRRGPPGFRFGAHERKMGIRACPAAELVFDGAEIPVANRLGGEGEGYKIALSALGEGRISIAAACVGIARAGLEASARYLQQRKAFGAPLAEQQGLRFMLAEMAREVAAARAVTREAAAARDRGEPIAEASSIAKWTASDAAMRVATDAVQLFGASGYSRETGIERLMRDAKGAQIYEGTNQIHRLIVADELLKRSGPDWRPRSVPRATATPEIGRGRSPGVDSGHDPVRLQPQRAGLHRQRGAHADREVRWRAGRCAGHGARRRRHPGGRGAGRAGAGERTDRRGPDGPGPAGRASARRRPGRRCSRPVSRTAPRRRRSTACAGPGSSRSCSPPRRSGPAMPRSSWRVAWNR